MRIKWNSNVARDIAVEMDRLEQEIGDCVVDLNRCAAILQQMQGGEMSQVIEKYVGTTETLAKKLRRFGESARNTSRGISRADELFEAAEARLRGRAEGMGSRGLPAGETGPAGRVDGYPTGQTECPPPPVIHWADYQPHPWPALAEVRRSVVIDQVMINRGVVMPLWLQGIIGARTES